MAFRVADHPDEASAVPFRSQRAQAAISLAVADDEPEALVVVLPHLPPLVERQGREAPLVGERLADGVVERPGFVLAEGVDG